MSAAQTASASRPETSTPAPRRTPRALAGPGHARPRPAAIRPPSSRGCPATTITPALLGHLRHQHARSRFCAGEALPIDDGNPCTDDACTGGVITHEPIDGISRDVEACETPGTLLGRSVRRRRPAPAPRSTAAGATGATAPVTFSAVRGSCSRPGPGQPAGELRRRELLGRRERDADL